MKQTLFLFCLTTIVMADINAQKFSGQFAGSQIGIQSTADLIVTGKQLGGSVSMNGNKATVTGTITDSASTGTVYDVVTGKTYSYYCTFRGNELNFSITFPELNNQAIQLQMQRIPTGATNEKVVNDPSKKKDARLVAHGAIPILSRADRAATSVLSLQIISWSSRQMALFCRGRVVAAVV